MISEGSCDTENGSNGFWNFSFAITGIKYILNCNIWQFTVLQYFHQINEVC